MKTYLKLQQSKIEGQTMTNAIAIVRIQSEL